ncbi:hypothetical protein JMJ35_003164 [Cladonia borealis]|uniref:Uncharacterized protein n=1 Tax=Cladonia borealis TaxID=184061 RepID=A0AA39R470_9LECA|nr:hypothetical protein JMJ35_003164 [Cladonia borealis]
MNPHFWSVTPQLLHAHVQALVDVETNLSSPVIFADAANCGATVSSRVLLAPPMVIYARIPKTMQGHRPLRCLACTIGLCS